MSFPNHIGQKASDIHRLLTRERLELYLQILREKLADKDRAAEPIEWRASVLPANIPLT
jgi:hypothetical protein